MKHLLPYVPGHGPSDARIMIVGEAPGKVEIERLEPFVGPSGYEMTKMLHQAGILRSECYLTNVCKHRPPNNRITDWIYTKTKAATIEHVFVQGRYVHPLVAEGLENLEHEIDLIKPDLIIAFGNTPLWALTGEYGITKWRGSGLLTRELSGRCYPLLPTYHPAAILRNYEWRFIGVHDLRKAKGILDKGLPIVEEDFCIRPNSDQVLSRIRELTKSADSLTSSKLNLAVDIETRFRQISCLGIAWSATHALCIPFLEIKAADKNYWKTLEEELEIVWALRKLLTHPNVMILGQGFSYDQQYIARRMAFIPNYKPENFHDTMTVGHILFAGLPKGLDFLSSFYCSEDHVYWKDEGKEWNPKLHDEERHWVYNCKDAVRTFAIAQEQRKVYEQLNFPTTAYGSPWTIQHKCHESILRAMLRGVNVDKEKKKNLGIELGETIARLEEHLAYLLGHSLNPRSPKQLQTLFYHDFKIKPVTKYDRSTGQRRRTCDADALVTISKREILLAPLCNLITDIRSLGTFKSVTAQELDVDDRFRCAYQVPGTETYRYNSKEDAFGYGTNLQNVSSGKEKDEKGNKLERSDHKYRPNLRKMFIPDPGFALADHDLEQADARVVAAESNCKSLLEIFSDPNRDLHNENCEIIFGRCSGKADPNRHKAKVGVHAAHYAATAKVIAAELGITTHQADTFLKRYFDERVEIPKWHERIRIELQTRRYVENVFGYRRFYFDRIEDLLKEALAWIPQSTVAITINLGIMNVERDCPWAQFLLQGHDSAVHQFPISNPDHPYMKPENAFELIRKSMEIELPYPKPMTIPVSGSWSLDSWGDCK